MASHFEKYAQKGNEFIKKVAIELNTPDDHEHAFRVTRAVFHSLRDRITVEESMDLISQLPMAIKAVYVDGWKVGKDRKKYHTKEELLTDICERAKNLARVDFGDHSEEDVRAVLHVIKQCVSEGEIADIKSQLPHEIAELLEI